MQQARLPFPPSRIYILVRNRFTFNTSEKGKQDISRPPSLQVIESNPEQVKLFGNSERKYAQTGQARVAGWSCDDCNYF